MHLKLFSTNREVKNYIYSHNNQVLEKISTIGEFLSKVVVVKNRAFISDENRVIYLFRAIENIDIEKLGFKKEFLSFVKNSEFIFKFFEELFVERVPLESLKEFDIYQDFEEHLRLLEEIYNSYKKLLEENQLVDKIIIDKYELNIGFLNQIDEIHFQIDGFLSKFELEILEKIPNKIILKFNSTKFNKKLIERLGIENNFNHYIEFDFKEKKILRMDSFENINNLIEIKSFTQPYFQINYIFQKIDEFIKNGANPENIAVILPNESLAKFLRLLDNYKNLNFAMGIPFIESDYYQTLLNLYKVMAEDNEISKKIVPHELVEKFNKIASYDEFYNFVENLEATNEEKKIIDEQIYKLKKFKTLLEKEKSITLLYQYINNLKQLSFDDVRSGKITVMGVLEARGLKFDGVIIPDFNEGVVPNVGDKDLFLNSFIKKESNMPTRTDKENLQKNYYYSIIRNSKYVAISFILNEEETPSRFLNELSLEIPKTPEDEKYSEIIMPFSEQEEIFDDDIYGKIDIKKFTPTRLKDYLKCKRKFYYKYLKNVKNDDLEDDEKVFGTIIHEALEEVTNKKLEIYSPEIYFEKLMNTIYSKIDSKIERFKIATEWSDKIQKFCEIDYERLMNYNQKIIEEWVSFNFAGFELSAKIDRVDENQNEIILIDYKSSSKVAKSEKDATDFQLLFYGLWAKKFNKEIKVAYYDLYNGELKFQDIWDREKELKMILENIENDNEICFEKTDDLKNCDYCEYKIACGRDE